MFGRLNRISSVSLHQTGSIHFDKIHLSLIKPGLLQHLRRRPLSALSLLLSHHSIRPGGTVKPTVAGESQGKVLNQQWRKLEEQQCLRETGRQQPPKTLRSQGSGWREGVTATNPHGGARAAARAAQICNWLPPMRILLQWQSHQTAEMLTEESRACVCVTAETQPLSAALLLRRSQTNLRQKSPLGTGEREKDCLPLFLFLFFFPTDASWLLAAALPSKPERRRGEGRDGRGEGAMREGNAE